MFLVFFLGSVAKLYLALYCNEWMLWYAFVCMCVCVCAVWGEGTTLLPDCILSWWLAVKLKLGP